MKRILLLTVIGTALLLFSAPGAWAFGVKDVVKMSDAGIPDSLIVMKIENSGKTFKLDGDDIAELRNADVSDEVISAMLQTEGRDRYDDYNGGYYHPYPYYYRPSRLYVGFGYRYGGRHYYGSPYYGRGYYPRRYQPYGSTSPYSGQGTTTRTRGSYGTRQPSGSGAGQYHGGGSTGDGTTSGSGTRSRSGTSGGSGGSGTRTRTR